MSKTRSYKTDSITVTYDVKKCIHAAECVHGSPDVFDPQRRPWIEPENGSADELATVIERCPSGALKYTRHDGGRQESIPDDNTISPDKDGPLTVRGNVTIVDQQGTVIEKGTRFTLCRCGKSGNKPFCDNSHIEHKFEAGSNLGEGGIKTVDTTQAPGELTITTSADGPLLVSGPINLRNADGSDSRTGLKTALCRCGHSSNKPFCDGSHRVEGFKAP